MLAIVHHQLLLFPDTRGHNWQPSPLGRGLRDKRTARQWVDSITAYCLWRAGEPWRSLSSPEQRWCQERRDYLDAVQLLENAFHQVEKPKGLHVALPILSPAPSPLPSELVLAELPRKALVDALLRENPKLTNRKILMHLKRRKLAHMLAAVRLAVADAEPERMRA